MRLIKISIEQDRSKLQRFRDGLKATASLSRIQLPDDFRFLRPFARRASGDRDGYTPAPKPMLVATCAMCCCRSPVSPSSSSAACIG
jgi:hypothetical protein